MRKDFEEEARLSIDFTYCLFLFILFDDVEVDVAVSFVVGEQLIHSVSRE